MNPAVVKGIVKIVGGFCLGIMTAFATDKIFGRKRSSKRKKETEEIDASLQRMTESAEKDIARLKEMNKTIDDMDVSIKSIADSISELSGIAKGENHEPRIGK